MTDDELEKEKARIRREFPACVAVADEFRSVFGDGVKVTYMCEAGREVGIKSPEVPYVTPAQMVLETTVEVKAPALARKRWRDA